MPALPATALRGMCAAQLQLSPACPTTPVQTRRPCLTNLVRILFAILLVGAAAALVVGWNWRAEKLALLQPAAGPLPPRPAPGTATGGVLLFGDSRVAQWRPLPERPYPITRQGHSGESAIRLVPSFEAALDRHKPDLAIVQAGVNDAVAASLTSSADRARALAASKAAFAAMAAAAEARGVKLIILKPIPPIRPDLARRLIWRGHVDPNLADLSQALPAIAAARGASLQDPLPLLGTSPAAVPEAFRKDTLHLTPAAYAQLNALLPPQLDPDAKAPPGGSAPGGEERARASGPGPG